MSKIYEDIKGAEQFRHGSSIVGAFHIKGQISGNEDLTVNGTVEGPIQLPEALLTVGPQGKVAGDVLAREVVVYGTVTGNVQAVDRVEIKSSGSVMGDLITARITIEDGARYKGAIEIRQK